MSGIDSDLRRKYARLLAENRYDDAEILLANSRESRTFAEAIANRRWVEALQFRPIERWSKLLAGWLHEHDLTRDELRELVPTVWLDQQLPVGPALGADDWVALWRTIGFYSNRGRPRPRRNVTLYRGVTADAAGARMSWTTSRAYAGIYARGRSGGRQLGAVYRVEASPTSVLAILEPEPEVYEIPKARRLRAMCGSLDEFVLVPDAARPAVLVESLRPFV